MRLKQLVADKTILLLAANPLAANPKNTIYLRLQEEERDIKERLRLAGYGKVPIYSTGATRTRDIYQALLDFDPQIVHFSGHGAGQEGLVFEDETGHEKLVNSEAIADLFRLFSDRVECVILNACYSEIQAQAIRQHIDYVIGMSQAIGDRAAIEFAVGFYAALGAGRPYEFSYDLGCNAIRLAGIRGHLTPVILKKNELSDAYQTKLSCEEPAHREQQAAKGNDETSSDSSCKSFSQSSREPNDSLSPSLSSTYFFYKRFTKSFPGVRGIKFFDSPDEALIRISKLLQEPLSFEASNSAVIPIWWWRGFQNAQIYSFKVINIDTILLNFDEFKIRKLAAVNARAYYQCFVYIESEPMEPSGIYEYTQKDIQDYQTQLGYFREELGVYKNNHIITRPEYDDGAAFIDGKLVELDELETELRVRYLTPYNFVIAASKSPINNISFDGRFEEIMNNILKGNATIGNLNEAVLTLPRNASDITDFD